MTARSALLGLVLLPLAGSGVLAQEEAQAFEPWSLRFTHEPLDVITVPYKDGGARTFNIMTFTLENDGKVAADLGVHLKAVVGSNPRKQRTHVAVPEPDAEEFVRRLSRTPDLKSVQDINRMGKLEPGAKVRGIAVFGTFDREWDVATVTVGGLEPRAIHARVRTYGDKFTYAHKAYYAHNRAVRKAAGETPGKDAYAVISHKVVWTMRFHREGDEFAPQLDPIVMDGEGWDVTDAKVVHVKAAPFGS
jgi:hypothetical protein